MSVDSSQLLKGTLDIALLVVLGEQESYGHELFQTLCAAKVPGLADASVYGALRRLEQDGALESRLVASSEGPARKYYRLTRNGRVTLAASLRAWRQLVTAMDKLVDGA